MVAEADELVRPKTCSRRNRIVRGHQSVRAPSRSSFSSGTRQRCVRRGGARLWCMCRESVGSASDESDRKRVADLACVTVQNDHVVKGNE